MDWINKRVLITGSAGFIGAELAASLALLGANVTDYDIVNGLDVLNGSQLQGFIERNDIELVYHLAAEAHVPIANKFPYSCLETNIMGTLNVLELCSRYNVPLIMASSDHAYGEAVSGFKTDTPLNAKHPYDLSKACADKIGQMYQDRGADVKIMRLCNVYGPGDTHHTRLIPTVIEAYMMGEKPVLRGTPDMVREWLYIDDAVQAYINAAEFDDKINLIGGECKTAGEVVEYIRVKLGGEPADWPWRSTGEIVNLQFAPLDNSKVSFEDGIALTIEWWKETM